jgi:hypothetical protein
MIELLDYLRANCFKTAGSACSADVTSSAVIDTTPSVKTISGSWVPPSVTLSGGVLGC